MGDNSTPIPATSFEFSGAENATVLRLAQEMSVTAISYEFAAVAVLAYSSVFWRQAVHSAGAKSIEVVVLMALVPTCVAAAMFVVRGVPSRVWLRRTVVGFGTGLVGLFAWNLPSSILVLAAPGLFLSALGVGVAAKGFTLLRASRHLRAIAVTQGSDIPNLMAALDSLRSAFATHGRMWLIVAIIALLSWVAEIVGPSHLHS